jgi:HEAT repeat protein
VIASRLCLEPLTAGTEQYRPEIAQALNPLLTEDKATKIAAAQALVHWGTQDNVVALVDRLTLDSDGDVRKAAIQALAQLKDPRGLAAVANRLGDLWDRRTAADALKSAGPAGEVGVIAQLKSKDRGARTEAAKILAVIGTEKSLPALEEVRTEKEHFFHDAVEKAITAIRTRLDVTKVEEPGKENRKGGKQ